MGRPIAHSLSITWPKIQEVNTKKHSFRCQRSFWITTLISLSLFMDLELKLICQIFNHIIKYTIVFHLTAIKKMHMYLWYKG